MRCAAELATQLLPASARLAVGLGLKGVLPRAGWAGLTDTPRRNCFRCGSPAPASAGFDVKGIVRLRTSKHNQDGAESDPETSALVFVPLLQFLPQLLEHLGSLAASQLVLQFFQCNRNHVVVVRSGKARVRGHFKPDPVQ